MAIKKVVGPAKKLSEGTLSGIKVPMSGNTEKNLSIPELKKKIQDWYQQRPVVVDDTQLSEVLDKTIIRRFTDAEKLLDEVTKVLEGVAEVATTKVEKKKYLDAVEKIDKSVGILKWGPHYADSAWAVPPIIKWSKDSSSIKKKS